MDRVANMDTVAALGGTTGMAATTLHPTGIKRPLLSARSTGTGTGPTIISHTFIPAVRICTRKTALHRTETRKVSILSIRTLGMPRGRRIDF